MESFKVIKTGINGLDTVLCGGMLKGRGFLVIGGPGTGKTILLSQFIYQGIMESHEKGVFVTFEERPKYISENVSTFGWDLNRLVRQNKLLFVDASPGSYY